MISCGCHPSRLLTLSGNQTVQRNLESEFLDDLFNKVNKLFVQQLYHHALR